MGMADVAALLAQDQREAVLRDKYLETVEDLRMFANGEEHKL